MGYKHTRIGRRSLRLGSGPRDPTQHEEEEEDTQTQGERVQEWRVEERREDETDKQRERMAE